MAERLLKRGDFVFEHGSVCAAGLVLCAGAASYDVVWIGGSTSRHQQGDGRCTLVEPTSKDFKLVDVDHLTREATAAREERRLGKQIKRGQVWPSR